MIKAFKYRIYPNRSQEILFSKTFGCVRLIWNANVASFNSYDKDINPKPNIIQKSDLIDNKPWLSEVSAAAIQQKVMDFKETLKQHFSKNRKKKIGRPSFKKKGNTQSYRLPNQKFRIEGDRIRIEKIGWVKMVVDRNIPDNGKIISCTISKNPSNQYFVSITVDCEITKKPKTGKEVGIDLGIKEFATLSDGVVIDNPKHLRENQPSSKTCSNCGWKKDDLTLSDRTFICENCGLTLDRDLNAALNIKRVGVDILYNRTLRDEVASPGEAFKIK